MPIRFVEAGINYKCPHFYMKIEALQVKSRFLHTNSDYPVVIVLSQCFQISLRIYLCSIGKRTGIYSCCLLHEGKEKDQAVTFHLPENSFKHIGQFSLTPHRLLFPAAFILDDYDSSITPFPCWNISSS